MDEAESDGATAKSSLARRQNIGTKGSDEREID
jgi:hypothetical protein